MVENLRLFANTLKDLVAENSFFAFMIIVIIIGVSFRFQKVIAKVLFLAFVLILATILYTFLY